MLLPSFLIIGAAKSGTTSLWAYLKQHPQVFLPYNKEPSYFALAGEKLPTPGPAPARLLSDILYSYCLTEFDDYLELFEQAGDQKARGEGSVRYLYYEHAAIRIREMIPDVRLVAILREPVSRSYSHYCMNRQYGLEPLGLREAIEAEAGRVEAGWGYDWHYANVSRYARQVRRYFELFGRERVKVFLFDDFVAQPLRVFQEVCRHIGVDDRFVPDMSHRDKVAYRPRIFALDRLLNHPGRGQNTRRRLSRRFGNSVVATVDNWNRRAVPKLSRAMRQEQAELFHDDVKELEDVLGRRTGWQ